MRRSLSSACQHFCSRRQVLSLGLLFTWRPCAISAKSAFSFACEDTIVYPVTDSSRRVHAVDYVINLSLPLLRMSSTWATKFKFQLEKPALKMLKTPLLSSNLKMDTIQDIILRFIIVRIDHMSPECRLRQILRHQVCPHLISR